MYIYILSWKVRNLIVNLITVLGDAKYDLDLIFTNGVILVNAERHQNSPSFLLTDMISVTRSRDAPKEGGALK